jgi:hypothetical protein
MAYKGYKGCGPKGLGATPLKQRTQTVTDSLSSKEKRSKASKQFAKNLTKEISEEQKDAIDVKSSFKTIGNLVPFTLDISKKNKKNK